MEGGWKTPPPRSYTSQKSPVLIGLSYLIYLFLEWRVTPAKSQCKIARNDKDQVSIPEGCGGGGAISYKPILDVPFCQGIIFQPKFLNRV